MTRIPICLGALIAVFSLGVNHAAAREDEVPRGSVSFDPTGVLLWGTSFSAEVDLGQQRIRGNRVAPFLVRAGEVSK